MGFKKLKDVSLHLYGSLLFSIIIFILLAFYDLSLAYGVALTILLLCLVIYIGELESIMKHYEDFYQSNVQEMYDKLK
jgi:ABC-type bacteriocin/lantibiotic exporter with double-glycine peptidase domain